MHHWSTTSNWMWRKKQVIRLCFVSRFKLQKNVGRLQSTGSQGSEGEEEEQIFLGDDQPVKLGEKVLALCVDVIADCISSVCSKI